MAVRVRTHHTMRITSPLKGGVAEDVQITLTDSEHSTIHFDPDIKAMKSNLAAVTELISHHEPTAGDPGAYSGYLYREVPADHVRRFLDSYRVPPNTSFDPALMVDYLARELAIGRLGEWNIFIPNGPGGPFALPGGRAVGLTRRSRLIEDPENPQRINIGALVDPPHRIVDLRPEAVANTLSGRSREAVIRERRNEPPLLIVYPIDKASAPPDRLGRKVRDRLGVDHDLIGMAIRFPTASTPNAVTYRAVPLDEPTYVYSDGGFEGGAP